MMENKIQNLTSVAFMAAILCVVGPFVIPMGIIPVSLTNMIIYLISLLVHKKKVCISVTIYLLIGLVGIPVFSGFGAGAGKLFGPTGGYLIGYLLLSFIAGSLLELSCKNDKKRKDENKKQRKISKGFKWGMKMLSLILGTMGLYLFGTLWLMVQSKLTFRNALYVGVFPFAALDILKMILAVSLAGSIKKRINFTLQ